MFDLTPYKRDKYLLTGLIQDIGERYAFKGNSCRCPFHDDRHPSAGIFLSQDGWRFKCQTCGETGDYFDVKAKINGTTPEAEIKAMSEREGRPATSSKTDEKPTFKTQQDAENSKLKGFTAKYTYSTDYFVYRMPKHGGGKYFQPLYFDGKVWHNGEKPGVQPLYNARGVANASVVVLVEGEKCVDALTALRVPAVTTPWGAGASKSKKFDFTPLIGKTVYLWPDNDECKDGEVLGLEHMKRIALILEGMGVEAKMVDTAPLNLPVKGDVVDFLDSIDGDEQQKRVAIWNALRGHRPTGARQEFLDSIDEIERGEFSSAFLPWRLLYEMSRFVTPGQVSIVVGEPGAGKSFLLVEIAANWIDQKIPFAFYALEDPRSFHMRRALAQRTNMPQLTDAEWVMDNAKVAREMTNLHGGFMDKLGASLAGESSDAITKEKLIDWISERIKGGARFIIVDPITMTKKKTDKLWAEDEELMDSVKRIARINKVGIVLASHPKKEDGQATLNAISGGAAIGRFAHKVIWLQHHINPAKNSVRTNMATLEMEHNRTIHILKARDTRGQGMRIAMNFGGDLKFYERGLIVSSGSKKDGVVSQFEERAIASQKQHRAPLAPVEEVYEDGDDDLF